MDKIIYSQLCDDSFDYNVLESVRANAYGFKNVSDYYYNLLCEKKLMVFTARVNQNIIGGCYVSNAQHALYVEQLFILRLFQNNGVGGNLLNYVLTNKKMVENNFSQEVDIAKIAPANINSERLYRSLGFRTPTLSLTGTMIKII